jgi:transposase-like protein
MFSMPQMIGVPVSISDLLRGGAESFWEAVRGHMSAWLVEAIQTALEQEIAAFAGAGWHERCADSRTTYRCGYRPRRLTVLGHDVAFRMPRVRRAGFRSEFLGYRTRRSEDVDRAIVNAYVAGASMREVTALLQQMWGTSVCPSTVSTLVKRLDTERRDFQSRRLADDYLYLILDAMYVRCQVAPSPRLSGCRGGESVRKVAVLLVRGIRADGRRELVDFRLAPGERETAWGSFLLSLYSRGLRGERTKLFIHDGSEGLENALDSVFGPGARQRCICHKLSNLWDAVADKDAHSSIRKDAAAIYDVQTAQQAWDRLAAFASLWGDREPKAVAVLTSDFEQTLGFLAVPREHRSWVTTTNPLERFIRELRRRTRPMGTFQGLASCRRLIYLAVKKLSDERRNAIPYSLWPSQPWYGLGRRTKRRRRCRLESLEKRFWKAFVVF